MPEVTIQIPDDVWAQLQRADLPADAVPQVAVAALSEWAGWLSGVSRTLSMSELETARIFTVYNNILTDEMPSVNELGRRFGLPLGRARYIVQSLSYQHSGFLRQRQLDAILEALDHARSTSNGETRTLMVDRASAGILDRAFNELLAGQRIASIVKGVPVAEGMRYDLGSKHYTVLREEMQRQRDELRGGDAP
jgi:hypothetical protein